MYIVQMSQIFFFTISQLIFRGKLAVLPIESCRFKIQSTAVCLTLRQTLWVAISFKQVI